MRAMRNGYEGEGCGAGRDVNEELTATAERNCDSTSPLGEPAERLEKLSNSAHTHFCNAVIALRAPVHLCLYCTPHLTRSHWAILSFPLLCGSRFVYVGFFLCTQWRRLTHDAHDIHAGVSRSDRRRECVREWSRSRTPF
jgi:hypothetical protein